MVNAGFKLVYAYFKDINTSLKLELIILQAK